MAEWVTRRFISITATIWERRGNNPDSSPKYVRVAQVDLKVTRLNDTEIRSKLRTLGHSLNGRDVSWVVNDQHIYGQTEADFLANAVEVTRSKNGTVRPLS